MKELRHVGLAMMESDAMTCAFDIDGNHVTLHIPESDGELHLDCVVYLHVVEGDGGDVWEQCRQLGCGRFALAAIRPRDWNDDLTPWECSGLFADDAPFVGNAQAQLRLLERRIIPAVEQYLQESSGKRIIAGYSLAGLFAAWAAFESLAFDGLASASGSFWYPGFAQFAREHSLASPVGRAYFSLGSKETRTPSRLLRNVGQGTQQVVDAFRAKGVATTFEQNPGNHFREPALRMAKGIRWVLAQ